MAFTSLLKIRFDDVDGAGIVYYPQFFHLCHKAFEDFFDDAASVSYPQLINEKRRGFPTVAIHQISQPPFATVTLRWSSWKSIKIGRSSATFSYEIRRKQDSRLCFSAKITKVYMDLDSNSVLPIPDDIRSLWESIL